ncbi:thrombospondin, partial [Micromonospora sp. CPCC 205556]
MNIPSLSRRRSVPAQDSNDDGRIDGRDGTPGDARPVVTDRDADRTTYRSNAAAGDGPDADAERRAADRAALARAATARPAATRGGPARVQVTGVRPAT